MLCEKIFKRHQKLKEIPKKNIWIDAMCRISKSLEVKNDVNLHFWFNARGERREKKKSKLENLLRRSFTEITRLKQIKVAISYKTVIFNFVNFRRRTFWGSSDATSLSVFILYLLEIEFFFLS